MTFQDAFAALHAGESAIMSFTEARLSIAHELGISPIRFHPNRIHPHDGEALQAVDAVRSYEAVRHILEQGKPSALGRKNLDEARMLMKPRKREKKATGKKDIVAVQNNLWKKRSY